MELVIRRAGAAILDYQVQAEADGHIRVNIDCQESSRDQHVVAKLYDDHQLSPTGDSVVLGSCIWEEVQPVCDGLCHLGGNVIGVRTWTAETPNLYTLTLSLVSGGKVHQVESTRVGFRTVEIVNGQVQVNGKAITVCGMNRHEHDPDQGKKVNLESMIRDVILLKQNNFNSVRTSHYPNHPSFYHLCDFFGLYVCDEANIEVHGLKPLGRLAHDWGWENTFVSRVARLVHRDRNHASVLYWSLGNEAGRGRNFIKARDLVRKLDSTRPIVYESGGAVAEGTGRTELTDVICTMYPDVDRMIRLATRVDEDRPVILCEYSHSMGNSNGNLHLYWEAFWREDLPRLQGGYIWDMIDQGLRKPCSNKKGFYFGYGGDFGDECNDLQFCINVSHSFVSTVS